MDEEIHGTGSADTYANARLRRGCTNHVSAAATLTMGTRNCGGLSKMKKDMVKNMDMDLACLTETHEWKDTDSLTVYSDSPPNNDKWSGVAIMLNKRISQYVIGSGQIGSRISYCRLRGRLFNTFIVGVYIPTRKRKQLDQGEIYTQLEELLSSIPGRDCIILMGDFNSRLSRNENGHVGPWCIHKERDSGGDHLLNIMKSMSLRCVSTYFQPKKRHTNATYMNIQPD